MNRKMVASSVLAAWTLLAGVCLAAEIKVDWDATVGPVKPVNGVGSAPLCNIPKRYGMLHYLKEAGIPYSRLHDVFGRYYVDIPNLFPDFNADENLESNYDFEYTDALIKELKNNGVEPFYRLGVTMEPIDRFRPRHIFPPKDFAKWARICEHVIMHYNEGWARGFKMDIAYWEIWNEPEGKSSWMGEFDDFIKFYGVVATHLKGRFPKLKIGGYGSTGFYAAIDTQFVPSKNNQFKWSFDCAMKFIRTAQERKYPLDFFSFHSYSGPREAARQIRYADWLLTQCGFTRDKTERIFDEWGPSYDVWRLGSASHAANVAEELICLQKSPCDSAMIYDASCSARQFSILFNPHTFKPHKAYYAFVAFNELRKLGTAVKCWCKDGRVECLAAKGPGGRAIMISNFGDGKSEVPITIGGLEDASAWIVDECRTWEKCAVPKSMPPNSLLLVKWEGEQ